MRKRLKRILLITAAAFALVLFPDRVSILLPGNVTVTVPGIIQTESASAVVRTPGYYDDGTYTVKQGCCSSTGCSCDPYTQSHPESNNCVYGCIAHDWNYSGGWVMKDSKYHHQICQYCSPSKTNCQYRNISKHDSYTKVEATCDTPAKMACSICPGEWDEGSATGNHAWEVIQDATCTDPGVEKCQNCNATRKTDVPGHDYLVTQTADCKVKEVKTCSRCGDKVTGEKNPSNHPYSGKITYSDTSPSYHTTETICKGCNNVRSSSAESHVFSYGPKNYTQTGTCIKEAKYTQTGTCSKCGRTVTQSGSDGYDTTVHSWGASVYSYESGSGGRYDVYTATCSDCHATEVVSRTWVPDGVVIDQTPPAAPHTHSWSSWTYTGESGRTSSYYYENYKRTCSVCGTTDTRQDKIAIAAATPTPAPAHTHSWGAWSLTSTAAGSGGRTEYYKRTCSCGAEETKSAWVANGATPTPTPAPVGTATIVTATYKYTVTFNVNSPSGASASCATSSKQVDGTCSTCSGAGVVASTKQCGTCGGTGNVTSPATCSTCNGSGWTYEYHSCSTTEQVTKTCSSCNSGKVRCGGTISAGCRYAHFPETPCGSHCRDWGISGFSGTGRCNRCGYSMPVSLYTVTCRTCGASYDVEGNTSVCSQSVNCSNCYGYGYTYSYPTCSTCNGRGYYYTYPTCSYCSGSGKVSSTATCGTCSGNKTVPTTVTCSKCNGNKKITTTVGTLPTAACTGYTFLGWFTTSTSGSQIATSTSVSSDTTYYAHWSSNKYTIALNNQSATYAGTSSLALTFGYGYSPASITVPKREYKVTFDARGGTSSLASSTASYVFGGYYTSTNGSGTQCINPSGTILSGSTAFSANTTLYAKWTASTVTLPTATRYWVYATPSLTGDQ